MNSTIRQIGTVFCTDNLEACKVSIVRQALEVSGLDPDIAKELSKRYCFIRAKNQLDAQGVIEEVSDTPDRITFQLSKRFLADNKLTYEYEAQIWFDKSAETIGSDSELLLQKANELFAHYGDTYLASDLSKLVSRIFDKQQGLISLRKAGAVYFVPQEKTELLNKVALFVRGCGGSVVTAEIGEQNSSVREKALDNLVLAVKSDLNNIVTELATLEKSSEPLTSRKAKNRYKQLKGELDRIGVFARSLNASTSDLVKKTKTADFDLAVVAGLDLDVIAALAHTGKISGALASIATTAFEGQLPPMDSPRVQKALALPEIADFEVPVIADKLVVGRGALAEVAA